MNPIRGSSAYNVPASSADPAEAAQTAVGAHPSGHASSLTLAMLSHHALDALNAKEAQGNKQEKTLAGFAKEAIRSGQLHISPNQPANGVAQFGMQRNQDIWVIKAKLNERSEYDVLSVGFRRGSEAPVAMTLPSPSTAVARTARHSSALQGLPNELLLHIVGSTGNRGEGVNLSLRQVNKQMKGIADDQLSPRLSFVVKNGQFLHNLGYRPIHMTILSHNNDEVKNFVRNNGEVLKNGGCLGRDITSIGKMTLDQQNSLLNNLTTLKDAGYQSTYMIGFAGLHPMEQNSLLPNISALKNLGYIDWHMNDFAKLDGNQQQFVLTNGTALKNAGYTGHRMNILAEKPQNEQDEVLHGLN